MGIWLVPDTEACEKIKLLRDEGFRTGGVDHKIDFQPHVTMFSFGSVVTTDELAVIIKAGRKKDETHNGTKTISEVDLDFAGIEAKNTFYRSEIMQIHESPMLKALLDYFADILDLDKAIQTPEIVALRKEIEANTGRKEKLEAFNKDIERQKRHGRVVKYFPHISVMYLTTEDRGSTKEKDQEIDSDKSGKLQEITTPTLDKVTNALRQSYVASMAGKSNTDCSTQGYIVKKVTGGKKVVYDKNFCKCKAMEIWITSCPTTETKKEGDMHIMKSWEVEKHRIRLDEIKGLGDFVEERLKRAMDECSQRCVDECIVCHKQT